MLPKIISPLEIAVVRNTDIHDNIFVAHEIFSNSGRISKKIWTYSLKTGYEISL